MVVMPLDEHVDEEPISDTEGQTLLWLIAVFYVAMAAVFYTCVFFALKAYSALVGTKGP
jgi:hypothetical protein